MIGVRLVPLLVDAGHEVVGMTRSAAKQPLLTELGATPVVCDAYDADRLLEAVVAARPELVMHQLTDLPDDSERLGEYRTANARIRREGTRNLVRAADAAGARKLIVQSVAWSLPGDAGRAVEEMERMVLDRQGVVVRYGQFYGPGTYHESPPEPPRVDIDRAAARTLDLLDAPSGIVTVVDD